MCSIQHQPGERLNERQRQEKEIADASGHAPTLRTRQVSPRRPPTPAPVDCWRSRLFHSFGCHHMAGFHRGFRSAALPDVQQRPPRATIAFASKAITKGSAANCVSDPDRTTRTGKTVRFRARGRRTNRGTASRSPRPRPPRPKAPGQRAPAPAVTEKPTAGAIPDCCSLPFFFW